MKILKFDHATALQVLNGGIHTTWRIYDDKDLSVNDEVSVMDKVDPQNPPSWKPIGTMVINEITEKQLADISNKELAEIKEYNSITEMLKYCKQRYGPHVTLQTPIKIIRFTLKENKNEELFTPKTSLQEAKIYADGGSRGNPGPSASGFAIMDMSNNIVVKKGLYLGITTNNQAEYQALKMGIEEALKLGVRELHVYMDSLLVINQMRGIFKVKNRDLWPIHESIKSLIKSLRHVSFTHVPRELNKIADGEVNFALDTAAREQ